MRHLALIAVLIFSSGAIAQQYRWVDERGRVQYTDVPPPPSARNVEKKNLRGSVVETSVLPFALTQLQKDAPVTLYTSPNCKEGCSLARAALNRRGVPFKEVQVWDEQSNAELKKVAGGVEVPVLVVGRTVQKGFEAGAFDNALDIGGYPRTGLAPRKQAAPPPPEGYSTDPVRSAAPGSQATDPGAAGAAGSPAVGAQ